MPSIELYLQILKSSNQVNFMQIYDKTGRLDFSKIEYSSKSVKQIVEVKHLFCHNGHNLVSPRAVFNGKNGILLKASIGDSQGMVALSPVFGDSSRITVDLDIVENGIYHFSCPECGENLKIFNDCVCGAPRIALFADPSLHEANCICICTRLGCHESRIISSEDIIGTFYQ